MQALAKRLWIPTLCVLLLALLGQCGRKSKHSAEPAPDLGLSVPSGWDGSSDWPDNALKVEDLAP